MLAAKPCTKSQRGASFSSLSTSRATMILAEKENLKAETAVEVLRLREQRGVVAVDVAKPSL